PARLAASMKPGVRYAPLTSMRRALDPTANDVLRPSTSSVASARTPPAPSRTVTPAKTRDFGSSADAANDNERKTYTTPQRRRDRRGPQRRPTNGFGLRRSTSFKPSSALLCVLCVSAVSFTPFWLFVI